MEYKRPNDIKSLHPDMLFKLRDILQAEVVLIGKLLDEQVESVCAGCDKIGYAIDDLPKDWAWFQTYKICGSCKDKLLNKFGGAIDRGEL